MERLELNTPLDDDASIPSLEVDECDAIRSLKITHLDDVYMEVSFATPIRRMIELCAYVATAPFVSVMIGFALFQAMQECFFSAFSIFAAWGVYGGAYHIRHKPKDQPIRVNRVRGKVYFSYYKDCPCAPRRGRVTARGYAWEQLRVWTWSTARGHQGIETIAESLRQTKKSSFAVFLMC